MLANGVTLPLPYSTACDVAEILARTGRSVPPDAWVDKFVERAANAAAWAAAERLPHNQV